MAQDLFIMEAYGKRKKMKEALSAIYAEGSERRAFDILPTGGHIMDLPKHAIGKDIGVNVTASKTPDGKMVYSVSMTLVPLPKSDDVISDLVRRAHIVMGDGGIIYLASDDDREGERISYDVRDILRKHNVPDRLFRRIPLTEVTLDGVRLGMNKIRDIDENLVSAQKARRVLDRIFGFILSPWVSQLLNSRGESAGRVQSAALNMVLSREEEAEKFVPEAYVTLRGTDKDSKCEFLSKALYDTEQAQAWLEMLKKGNFEILDLEYKNAVRKSGPNPLSYADYMSAANKELKLTLKESSEIAQDLYLRGVLSYPRTDLPYFFETTDSIAREGLSHLFPQLAKLEWKPKSKKISGDNVQGAHDALHPAVDLLRHGVSGDDLVRDGKLSPREARVYDMVLRYALASVAPDMKHDVTIAKGGTPDTGPILSCTGNTIREKGWTEIIPPKKEKTKPLPEYRIGDTPKMTFKAEEKKTTGPAAYTEGTFLAAIKESIGRPSTYEAIISTLFSRGYISKGEPTEKGGSPKIATTEKGRSVARVLREICPEITQKEYTANMEKRLDVVQAGKAAMENIVVDAVGVVSKAVQRAKALLAGRGASATPEREENRVDEGAEAHATPTATRHMPM